MEIRVLKYFVEAAKEKNITKAAANLHITQPTLSRQLKQLEEELGQKLFFRSNYSIHLSEEGKILFKRAIDILRMVDKTSAEFASMSDFQGGDIHIGCAESEGISYIAKAAKTLQDTFPMIRYHLYSGNAETVIDRLDKGLLDFAIVVQNIDITKYECLSIPTHDTWGLLMRKDALLAKQEFITFEDLAHIPLILSRQGITDEMPEWLKKNKEHLHVVATYDLLYNASILVREGLGYALCFDKLIDTGPNSNLCFKAITPSIKSPIHIIWNQHHMFSKSSELLLQELEKECITPL